MGAHSAVNAPVVTRTNVVPGANNIVPKRPEQILALGVTVRLGTPKAVSEASSPQVTDVIAPGVDSNENRKRKVHKILSEWNWE